MLNHGEKDSGEAKPLRRRCDYLAQVWMNHQRAGSGPEVFDACYVSALEAFACAITGALPAGSGLP